MVEIRIHGRGGQGGVTLAKLIATSRFLEGQSVQAFGLYAAERSGAPVQAFCRFSHDTITNRNLIYEPDHVVLLDPTLVALGIIVFNLRLASDMEDPMLRELGSQVSQMLVSELGGGGRPGEYAWDGLAAFAGEGAYQYFYDRILMSEMMPATHALFGRLAIRGGQMSVRREFI